MIVQGPAIQNVLEGKLGCRAIYIWGLFSFFICSAHSWLWLDRTWQHFKG